MPLPWAKAGGPETARIRPQFFAFQQKRSFTAGLPRTSAAQSAQGVVESCATWTLLRLGMEACKLGRLPWASVQCRVMESTAPRHRKSRLLCDFVPLCLYTI